MFPEVWIKAESGSQACSFLRAPAPPPWHTDCLGWFWPLRVSPLPDWKAPPSLLEAPVGALLFCHRLRTGIFFSFYNNKKYIWNNSPVPITTKQHRSRKESGWKHRFTRAEFLAWQDSEAISPRGPCRRLDRSHQQVNQNEASPRPQHSSPSHSPSSILSVAFYPFPPQQADPYPLNHQGTFFVG